MIKYKNMKIKVTILVFCCFAFIANSQEIEVLTLKNAVNYALENKADAKKSKLEIENSEYQIQEIRSRALPHISANGGLTYNPILQKSVIDGEFFGQPGEVIEVNFGQKWYTGVGVSLSQTIFDQSVFTGLKAANSTREFYRINDQLTQEMVIERVANNYYQVYVQRQNLKAHDSNLANTIKVKNIIQGRFNNGLAKKIDLDRILVKISNINTERQRVINVIQLRENSLKFYMGMPIETQIQIPETEFDVTLQTMGSPPNAAKRSEYLLLKKQEELLSFQKKDMEAKYYPTLSLAGGYTYVGQGLDVPWFKSEEHGVYWSDFSSISLNLNIPVFTGFNTQAKVRQANIDLKMIQEDLANTKLALDLDYENAKTQQINNIITINNQKENIKLAQDVLKNTNNNYLQGLASLTDLLDAENASTEAKNNFLFAVLQFKLAEIQLLKSRGELKTLTY